MVDQSPAPVLSATLQSLCQAMAQAWVKFPEVPSSVLCPSFTTYTLAFFQTPMFPLTPGPPPKPPPSSDVGPRECTEPTLPDQLLLNSSPCRSPGFVAYRSCRFIVLLHPLYSPMPREIYNLCFFNALLFVAYAQQLSL